MDLFITCKSWQGGLFKNQCDNEMDAKVHLDQNDKGIKNHQSRKKKMSRI